MKQPKNKDNKGFSLIEVMIAMSITIVLMGLVSTLLSAALGTRRMESQRTDALTSAQAALNVISREISNSGFGIKYSANGKASNGLVSADSNNSKIHFNSNIVNSNTQFCDRGEDVTFYYDASIESIVRHERYSTANPLNCSSLTTETSIVVNRISDVKFIYWDYVGSNSTPVQKTVPTANTGRVTITVTVELEPVNGQPSNQKVTFSSDVTLRNASYMLNQY
ncbi:MAG TPA: type II secretion system protein [Pyrinomonadaceae bacterium]|nr:type II secretion system protein [Pyrinomonadaceae bacterium]